MVDMKHISYLSCHYDKKTASNNDRLCQSCLLLAVLFT